jgi:predicted Fe-Mo cluster-binding NifX family protein
MIIIFTSKGTTWDSLMDSRFGRANYFVIYNEESSEISSIDNQDSENEAHGAGTKSAQGLYDLKANVLITGNGPGGNAASIIEKLGISCFIGANDMTVKEAYQLYKEGKLKQF